LPAPIYSYRGEVTIGLMVDAALIPDPHQIVVALGSGRSALITAGQMPRSRVRRQVALRLRRPQYA
jgi:hypothetical protein